MILRMATPICRLIDISGTARERGLQYGRQARDEIHAAVGHYRVQIGTLSDTELEALTARFLPMIADFDPRYLEEIEAIAAGSGASLAGIVLVNARTEILKLAARPDAALRTDVPDGCTTLAVEPRAAQAGELLHGHNWDWKLDSASASIMLRVRSDDAPDFLTFTEAGALARLGVNARGLSVTGNYLECERDYRQLGVPLALIRRKVLEQTHLARAVQVVATTPKSASNNVALGDARAGCTLNFECAPDESFELETADGILLHTNHWLSAAARAKLIERGLGAMPDSITRYARARRLLNATPRPVSAEAIRGILLDQLDSPWSICQPAHLSADGRTRFATVASVVMSPGSGRIELALLPTVNPVFTTYTLDGA